MSRALENVKRGFFMLAPFDESGAPTTLHVSDDGHLALLWLSDHLVLALFDEPDGIRGRCFRRKGLESTTPSVGSMLPAQSDNKAVQEGLAMLQGEWLLVSGSSFGSPIPDPGRKPTVRIRFSGTTMTTSDKRGQFRQERVTLDPSMTPKAIDFELITRSGNTRKRMGIYDLADDQLRVCFSGSPFTDRPKMFSGMDGVLMIFQRENPRGSNVVP
jgi:uncharacterized protein (TIGR03067 family)